MESQPESAELHRKAGFVFGENGRLVMKNAALRSKGNRESRT